MSFDYREFIDWIITRYEPSVRLDGPAGSYARQPGDKSPELYGVADMACILYTIGHLNPTESQRHEWAESFHAFQNSASGYLLEKNPTHVPLHNTAFALAAMNLLGLRPLSPLSFASQYRSPENLRSFLDGLDWTKGVYKDSHAGAGLGSIFALSPDLSSPQWFEHYFSYCDSLFDPYNGLMGRDKPPSGDNDQIGGTFHYHFLYEHFNRRMPHPERRIDSVIALQQPDGYWHPTNHLWMTLDALYLLTRTARHYPYRTEAIKAIYRRTLGVLNQDVFSADGRRKHFGGKLGVHSLTCAVSILAEGQNLLGAHEVVTEWPLKLVLDRRPFI